MEEKWDGGFVGFRGFDKFMFDVEFGGGIEIVWGLREEYWGGGYGREGGK